MRPALPQGRALVLAGGGNAWLWLAAGLLALSLLILLYRYERRLVTQRAGLTLLGLRLAAALLLVSMLFEPIAAWSFREQVRGRVLVGVDLSDSMATVDTERPPSERARLMRTLRLSPNEPPEILSRREVARRLLEHAAFTRLAAGHTIEAVGFARRLVPGTLPALGAMLAHAPRPGDSSGAVTDWTPVLEQALKYGEDAPLLGVVLLTDGQQNAPGPFDPLADRLAARGVPVHSVLIGSPVPPRDVAIASVKAPEAVYKGDVATIDVALKADGFPGRDLAVALHAPGALPQRRRAHVPRDGARPIVSFRVPMTQAGLQAIRIAVEPPPGDSRDDNNERTIAVQVADDQANVLLVEGEARWEFQYLRNALVRDPRVKVTAIVLHQPASAATAETTYRSTFPVRSEAARDQPDPLGAFDMIVVGDVAPGDLPGDAWARLEAYVAERGGTLAMSAGPRGWPALLAEENVRRLAPVTRLHPADAEATANDPAHASLPPGVSVLPVAAADAQAWPMLQFAAEPAENRAAWAALPRLPWVLTGRVKPGAAALAATGARGPDAQDRSTVIAAQAYGLGKVLWVGTDGTWRWRYRTGDAYHHRFWGQVVRWATAGKLAAGNRFVRFGPVRPRVAEDRSFRIQARISEGVEGVRPDLLVAARVVRARAGEDAATGRSEAVAVVPLRPVPGQPRTFEGTAPALPVGSYAVRLEVPERAEALGLTETGRAPEAHLEVTATETSERIELAARRELLESLSSSTHGRVLADYEVDRLPELFASRILSRVRTEELSLWDRPGALLLFFGLLTVEWIVRKRLGLP